MSEKDCSDCICLRLRISYWVEENDKLKMEMEIQNKIIEACKLEDQRITDQLIEVYKEIASLKSELANVREEWAVDVKQLANAKAEIQKAKAEISTLRLDLQDSEADLKSARELIGECHRMLSDSIKIIRTQNPNQSAIVQTVAAEAFLAQIAKFKEGRG